MLMPQNKLCTMVLIFLCDQLDATEFKVPDDEINNLKMDEDGKLSSLPPWLLAVEAVSDNRQMSHTQW